MKKPFLLLYVLLIVFTACIGCGKDNICTPSQEEPCSCQEGTSGTKLCSSDGTRYSACSCPALEKSDEKRPSEEDFKETHKEKLPDAGNEHSVYPEKETTFEQEPPTEHTQSEEPYREKECIDGTEMACYLGPNNTKNIGICKSGKKTCSGAGFWGPCLGQVLPDKESCNGKDDDCNGQIDESYPEKGASCNTQKLGQCAIGLYTCSSSSLTCQQIHSSKLEECNGKDDNCDGKVDEGLKQSCYTGPANTAGTGVCQRGEQLCQSGQWGTCVDEVVPQTEVCNGKDDDCNGVIDDKGISTLCASGESCEGGVCYKNCQQDTDCSGNEGCQNSLCKVIQCTSPSVACAHDCQDVQKEYAHCGMCGHSCQDEQVCQSGMCICDASTSVLCSGKCTNIHVNSQHCGGCQNACSAGKFCFQKTCTDSWLQNATFKIYSASGWDLRGLAIDPSGNIFIGGRFELEAIFGTTKITTPNYDTTKSAFFAKLGKNGRWLSANRVINSTNDAIIALTSDDKGNIYVLASFLGNASLGSLSATGYGYLLAKLDAKGRWLWIKTLSSIVGTPYNIKFFDGALFMTGGGKQGDFNVFNPKWYGNRDLFVAKLDTNANVQWVATAGSTGSDLGISLTFDSNKNIYIGGHLSGTGTFGSIVLSLPSQMSTPMIAKLGSSGKWLWARKAPSLEFASDANGNIYFCGEFANTLNIGTNAVKAQGVSDIFAAKLDTNGNWKWLKTAGSTRGQMHAPALDVDSNGNMYILGELDQTTNFGSVMIHPTNGKFFIIKLDTNGTWKTFKQNGLQLGFVDYAKMHLVQSRLVGAGWSSRSSKGVIWSLPTF